MISEVFLATKAFAAYFTPERILVCVTTLMVGQMFCKMKFLMSSFFFQAQCYRFSEVYSITSIIECKECLFKCANFFAKLAGTFLLDSCSWQTYSESYPYHISMNIAHLCGCISSHTQCTYAESLQYACWTNMDKPLNN